MLKQIERVVGAGVMATGAMTAVTYAAPHLGMPTECEARLLGTKLSGREARPGSKPWWIGFGLHWLNGAAVFSVGYAVGRRYLRGPSWAKGLQWGALLWVLSQALLMPEVGAGFFSSARPHRRAALAENLAEHLLYGAILGAAMG